MKGKKICVDGMKKRRRRIASIIFYHDDFWSWYKV